ncbi:MAG TPA: HAD family hydrolase [Hyphomicrobiales bacterium]|nr:HAD family hydrolase [Hyphomicrobiales bacterium]
MTAIRLVISDVDGTLVTSDKRLTEASVRAARRLHEAGIGFTVTSSRPPFGLRMLIEPLGLTLPFGAFNGGAIVAPNLTVLDRRTIPPDAARTAIAMMRRCGAAIWLFTCERWLVTDAAGPDVARERHTVQAEPVVVAHFDEAIGDAVKIVGVSDDHPRLARCEAEVRSALAGTASAARSQAYYLDVTPPGVDKGTFVEAMAARLGIATDAVAVLGDMENDLAMFAKAGFSVAMGNATDAVKARAGAVTRTNDEDGFAHAVETLLLPGAAAS